MRENTQTNDGEDISARRRAMALYAEATIAELQSGVEAIAQRDHIVLRKPETGLVMIRGRIGGDGAPFNLGEATVTRAAVRSASGSIGYSYILGRDHEKAKLAALCDALWQDETARQAVEAHILAPIGARLAREREGDLARTASTRVDFFTLVRGEDAA